MIVEECAEAHNKLTLAMQDGYKRHNHSASVVTLTTKEHDGLYKLRAMLESGPARDRLDYFLEGRRPDWMD